MSASSSRAATFLVSTRTASSVLTRRTIWTPPFRSSPSFSRFSRMKPGLATPRRSARIGYQAKIEIPNVTASVTTNFQRNLLFIAPPVTRRHTSTLDGDSCARGIRSGEETCEAEVKRGGEAGPGTPKPIASSRAAVATRSRMRAHHEPAEPARLPLFRQPSEGRNPRPETAVPSARSHPSSEARSPGPRRRRGAREATGPRTMDRTKEMTRRTRTSWSSGRAVKFEHRRVCESAIRAPPARFQPPSF